MKKKLTIKKLLGMSHNLRFMDIPYFKTLYPRLPEHLDIDITESSQVVLQQLEQDEDGRGFLMLKLEDILIVDERKAIRCLIRWSFFTGIIGSFGALAVVIYLAYVTKTMPDVWSMVFLVGVPAGIMWTQAGVLKSEHADSIGKILNQFRGKSERRSSRRNHYDEERYDEDEDYPTITRRPRRPMAGLDDDEVR